MNSSAPYQVHGQTAVITLNNPPVNGLGHALRSGIVEGLDQALADAAVKAVVLIGTDRAFSGGADVREFGTPKAHQEPNLLSVILALEAASKPIVAAVHSVCMGGGLELALGCHYRVAAPGCKVALPEVKLGLAELAFGIVMPVAPGEAPQDASMLVKLVDLTISDDIWGMIDPAANLPRDPITAIVDLKGTLTVMASLLATPAPRLKP